MYHYHTGYNLKFIFKSTHHSIDCKITAEDCVNPHESLIWKYFGTTGTNETDWCVTDGPFTEQTKDRCIKRQWNLGSKLSPWYCPDIENIGLGFATNFREIGFFALGQHFHHHLNIGGWHGHFSQNWAPYEYAHL